VVAVEVEHLLQETLLVVQEALVVVELILVLVVVQVIHLQ
tara:strand:- start:206 stop:325 length:120 start_codon:yes stop_codon:yes gene_type:complete